MGSGTLLGQSGVLPPHDSLGLWGHWPSSWDHNPGTGTHPHQAWGSWTKLMPSNLHETTVYFSSIWFLYIKLQNDFNVRAELDKVGIYTPEISKGTLLNSLWKFLQWVLKLARLEKVPPQAQHVNLIQSICFASIWFLRFVYCSFLYTLSQTLQWISTSFILSIILFNISSYFSTPEIYRDTETFPKQYPIGNLATS